MKGWWWLFTDEDAGAPVPVVPVHYMAPAERTARVPAEQRRFNVRAEHRVSTVPVEGRRYRVQAEQRRVEVPAEQRRVKVGES